MTGSQEVVGSSPIFSTKRIPFILQINILGICHSIYVRYLYGYNILNPKNFLTYLITWRRGGFCRMVFLWRLGYLVLFITPGLQGWDQSKSIANYYHHWSNRAISDASGGVCLGVLELLGVKLSTLVNLRL